MNDVSWQEARGPGLALRVLATLGAVVLLYVGSRILMPGLNPDFRPMPGPYPSVLERVSIFALGVTPIIAALAIVEILRLAAPPLARWAAASGENSARLAATARVVALCLAAIQAYGLALAIERVNDLASEPGWTFRLGVVATGLGATALLAWLADWVTRYGVGDGLLIFLAAPIVGHAPRTFALWFELGRMGAVPSDAVAAAFILTALSIALLVFASKASREWLASRAGAAFGGALDIWPALLAMTVFQAIRAVLVALFGLEDAERLLGGPFDLLAFAALIAFFAVARAHTPGSGRDSGAGQSHWPTTIATIIVCVGAALFSFMLRMTSELSGFSIVFVVAAALSLFDGGARPTGPDLAPIRV